MSNDVKSRDVGTTPAPVVAGPPVLVGDHLRVEVVCDPPPKSPFGPVVVHIVPFTRGEIREYESALKGKEGKAWEEEQAKRLADRIKSWNVEIVPGTPAEVNAGTVARLPYWAFGQLESALFGEAGKLVGNLSACSG